MEEKLEKIFNYVFLKYRFLFLERKNLEFLVKNIKRKYKKGVGSSEAISLNTCVFDYYLAELEGAVRKYLKEQMQIKPLEILNNYINMELEKSPNPIVALDSVVYLCDMADYKLSNIVIKQLLENNEIFSKLVQSCLKDGMLYLRDGALNRKVTNPMTREFIYSYCDLENIDVLAINPTSKYPYYGYALSPFSNTEEELAIINKAKNGDKNAREEIILRYIKLITNRAIKSNNGKSSLDDLVQEGIVGLLTAIEKYDNNSNIKFDTYADYWIKSFILAFIKTRENTVKYSGSEEEIYREYLKYSENYLKEFGIMPNLELAAKELNTCKERLEKILNIRRGTVSLDAHVSEEETDSTMLDLIVDKSLGVEDSFDDLELKRNLNIILNNIALTEKEKIVVYFRFGFDGSNGDYPREKIARLLGVSQQRIKQIEKTALRRIHKSVLFQQKIGNSYVEEETELKLLKK